DAVDSSRHTGGMKDRHSHIDRHPTGFWFVFWGELAERASYYGMRTLRRLYLVDRLRYGTADAASLVQFFMSACYVTPILGGWVADRWLGRYRTIAAWWSRPCASR